MNKRAFETIFREGVHFEKEAWFEVDGVGAVTFNALWTIIKNMNEEIKNLEKRISILEWQPNGPVATKLLEEDMAANTYVVPSDSRGLY